MLNKIVFIGMAGSGKSYFGKKLSERLGFLHYDDDIEMFKKYGLDTTSLLEKVGDEEFLKIEEDIFRKGFQTENVVMSPGGSIVYSHKLMEDISNQCLIVYLQTDLEKIIQRVKDEPRGIVYLKNNDLKELFSQREKLYKKYAHLIININVKNDDEVLDLICRS